MAVTFGLVLAVLSGLAVLGSWRQATIVTDLAADADKIDAFQEAILLSQREMELVQAVLNEPDGTERQELLSLHDRTHSAIEQLAQTVDAGRRASAEAIAGRQAALEPTLRGYLSEIDQGHRDAAADILEQDIELRLDTVAANLQTIAASESASYLRARTAAEDDSRTLFWGSVAIFLLTLALLALYARSTRAHRRQIEHLASVDALTGLPNRAGFAARIRAMPACATVVLVNLDGFRDVNDQFGHQTGDLLLVEAGERIVGAVRADDMVSRLGGDDFAILVTDCDSGLDEALAHRLHQAFREPFALDGVTVDIEVSVGAATAQPGADAAAVLVHADLAMHEAKEQRSGFRRFDPEATQEYAARLTMLGDLRRALAVGDQLTLHYQPKIVLAGGDRAGVEALARWTHPERGFVSPAEFIPVLETTSLIHDFTDWALSAALAQARRWHDAGQALPVSVNISTRTLLDRGFPERVGELLRSAGVPGHLLCVEITEYTVMSDPETTIGALRRIRELGVKTSLDDYGTGYSSMAYLKSLPLDELKIDRTFVRDMIVDAGSLALVESAVTLGHRLGLTVVAEGIEDAETAGALRTIGCDLAQGYHFARPMPADQISATPRRELTPHP
ncbi:putative bifunctional diguanylate cyclase/phosphodiesterase [Actinoplanes sp. NPDC049265]|uniref:putative bifunctional diguanylate cyclase/phosphodiesterase n=1 Tax=Actinoplanes sp. NPDC049265 TaxID=3363902 RepID=UPI0037153F0A